MVFGCDLIQAVLDRQRIDRVQDIAVAQIRIAQSKQRGPNYLFAAGLAAFLLDEFLERAVAEARSGSIHQCVINFLFLAQLDPLTSSCMKIAV